MAPRDEAGAAEAALGISTRLSDPTAEPTVRKGLELLREEASGPRSAEVLRALSRAAPDWAPLLSVWEYQAAHHAGGENQPPLLLAVASCLDACGRARGDGGDGGVDDDERRKRLAGAADARRGEFGDGISLLAFGSELAQSVPQRWLRTISSALASGQYSRQAAALELLAAVVRYPDPSVSLELLSRWDYGHSALVEVARAWRAGRIVLDQAQGEKKRDGKGKVKKSKKAGRGAESDEGSAAVAARPLSPAQLYRRWYSRDPLKRPLRSLYVSFAVASLRAALESPSRSALASLLSRRQPGNPASLLLAGVASDPPAAAREVLETVSACLAKRSGAGSGGRSGGGGRNGGGGDAAGGELSAPLLRPLWSAAGLRALWEISCRDEDEDVVARMLSEEAEDVEANVADETHRKSSKKRSREAREALSPEVLAARPPVSLAQRLLRTACTDPSVGLASAAGAAAPAAAATSERRGVSLASPGQGASSLASAGQRTLLRFFFSVHPGTTPFGDELLAAACARDPALACATLAEAAPSWPLEPAPTPGYLCASALAAEVLPAAAAAAEEVAAAAAEQLLAGGGGGGVFNCAAASAATLAPAPLAARLAALALPPAVAARAPLSRGLQHADGLVRLSTLRVLRALLGGVARVRRRLEASAATAAQGPASTARLSDSSAPFSPLSTPGAASLGPSAARAVEALVALAAARLPDPQLLLSARLAAERTRAAGSPDRASLAEHALLATLRAWRLALPETLVSSRVDVGKIAAALGRAALPSRGQGEPQGADGHDGGAPNGAASASARYAPGDPSLVDAACALLNADLFVSGNPPARTFGATLAASPPLPAPQHLLDVALLAALAPRPAARSAARAWLIERLAATRLCEPEDAAAWALCLPRDEPAAAALLAGAAARAARQAVSLVPRAGALGALSLAAALDACALERAAATKQGDADGVATAEAAASATAAAARSAGYVKAALAVIVSARPGARGALERACMAGAAAGADSADAVKAIEGVEKATALRAFAADALSLADASNDGTRAFRALLADQRGELGRRRGERGDATPQPGAPLGDASTSPEGAALAALAFQPSPVDAVALANALHRPSDVATERAEGTGGASLGVVSAASPAPLPGPWARSAALTLLAGLAGNRLAAARSLEEATCCAADVDVLFRSARHGGVRAECLAQTLSWIVAGLEAARGSSSAPSTAPAPGCLLPACLLAARCESPAGALRAATRPLVAALTAALGGGSGADGTTTTFPTTVPATAAEFALCLAAGAGAASPDLLACAAEASLRAALRPDVAEAPSPLPAAALDLLAAVAETGPEHRRALAGRSQRVLPLALQLLVASTDVGSQAFARSASAAAAWAALLGEPSRAESGADAPPVPHAVGSSVSSERSRRLAGADVCPRSRGGDALAALAAAAMASDVEAQAAAARLLAGGTAAAARLAGQLFFESAPVAAAFAGALDALASGDLATGSPADDATSERLLLAAAEAFLAAAAGCMESLSPARSAQLAPSVAALASAATRVAAAALTGALVKAPSTIRVTARPRRRDELIASARACLAAAVRSGAAGASDAATEALKRVCRRLKRGDREATLLEAGVALLPLCAARDAAVATKALPTLAGAASKLVVAGEGRSRVDDQRDALIVLVPLAHSAVSVVAATAAGDSPSHAGRCEAALASSRSLIADVCAVSGRLAEWCQKDAKRAAKAGEAASKSPDALAARTASVGGLDAAADLVRAALDALSAFSPSSSPVFAAARQLAEMCFASVASSPAFVPTLREPSASPPPLPGSAAEAPRPPPSALLLLPPGGADASWSADVSQDAHHPAGLKRAAARALALALALDRAACAGLLSAPSAPRSAAALAPTVSSIAGLAPPAASALLKMLLAAYGASLSAADRAVWAGIRELNLRLWAAERVEEPAAPGWGSALCEEAIAAFSRAGDGGETDAAQCRALLEGPLAKAGFAWGSAAKAVSEKEAPGTAAAAAANGDAAVAALDSVRCALSVAAFPSRRTALGLEGVADGPLEAIRDGGSLRSLFSSEKGPGFPAGVDPAAVLPAALCALRSGAATATALSRCGVAALALRCLSARDDALRGLAAATLGRLAAEVRAQRGMAWWVGGDEIKDGEEVGEDDGDDEGANATTTSSNHVDAADDVAVPVLFSEDPSNKARDAKESRAQRRRRLDPPRRSHEERFARPEASLAPACRERVPLGLALQRAALSADEPGARLSPAAAIASAEAALAAPHPEHELFAHLCRAAAVGAPNIRAGDAEPLLAKHAVSGRPEAVAPRRWALRALRAAAQELAHDERDDAVFALAERALRRSGAAQLAVTAAEAAPWHSAAAEDAEAAAAAAAAAVGPGAASAAGLVGWLGSKASAAAEAAAKAPEGSRARAKAVERARHALRSLASVAGRFEARGSAPPSRALRAELAATALRVLEAQRHAETAALANEALALVRELETAEESAGREEAQANQGEGADGDCVLRSLAARELGDAIQIAQSLRV